MTSIELAMVVASALLHAIWSVAIKRSRDPLAFNLLQTAMMAALGLALVAWVDLSQVPRGVWILLATTGVAHALYMYFMSRAMLTRGCGSGRQNTLP